MILYKYIHTCVCVNVCVCVCVCVFYRFVHLPLSVSPPVFTHTRIFNTLAMAPLAHEKAHRETEDQGAKAQLFVKAQQKNDSKFSVICLSCH